VACRSPTGRPAKLTAKTAHLAPPDTRMGAAGTRPNTRPPHGMANTSGILDAADVPLTDGPLAFAAANASLLAPAGVDHSPRSS
jgi:hypothetical protein